MPPRTRGIKASKTLKENLGIVEKKKFKPTGKNTNPTRKALADKTNSASDDNASIEKPKNVPTKVVVNGNAKGKNQENCVTNRPRRERKLPNRFEENNILKNVSNNKDSSLSSKTDITVKNNKKSLFKTPQKCDESSLMAPRPTRVSRLPSRFEDHSMSPHKFIPVQPLHSSTPTVPDNGKKSKVSAPGTKNIPSPVKSKENKNSTKQTHLSPVKNKKSKLSTESRKKATKEIKKKEKVIKNNADTNNNPPQRRNLRVRKKPVIVENSTINDNSVSVDTCNEINKQANAKVLPSPKKKTAVISTLAKKINTSFRVLDKKQSEKETGNNVDVYEFTFDPNEEPPPQKKKKKRIVKKKPAKPKMVIIKSTYEDNVSKALSVLKSNFAKKPVQPNSGDKAVHDNINNGVQSKQNNINSSTVGNIHSGVNNQVTDKPISNESMHPLPMVNTTPALITTQNSISDRPAPTQNSVRIEDKPISNESMYPLPMVNSTPAQVTTQNSISDRPAPTHNSIRIEDIVLDFQNSNDHHEIDYSPVNSPYQPKTPIEPPSIVIREPSVERHNSHDPLNLKDNLSFFDAQPVANSSMNISARHPHASPWRVEFQNLPIKWHVNSYVKPNMTPAVECSFVNFNDSNKKKHVYTNLVPQSNEELPEIVEKDTPNLIQTSIISFIKEVAEKSATKKRGRSRSTTPATLFNDLTNDANKNPNRTPRQVSTPKKNEGKNTDASTTPLKEISGDIQLHKGISREYLKRKCNSNEKPVPAKTPRKNMDNTYFGFDETDEIDQENVSPKKTDNPRARALRPRARAVLKEINEQSGPVRANIPLAAKSGTTNSDTASKLYEQMKSATDAPVFPDENAVMDVTDINNAENNESNDEEDSQSVHLFEDIELIHHFKQPHHKSYGKAKKVAFQVNPSDSETQDSDFAAGEQDSSEEDNLLDLTFEMPAVEEKKKRKMVNKKKQKFTKKEEAEAEAWAAGFNSMCEEVEDFPLVVE